MSGLDFLVKHGNAVLFAVVLGEQFGLPIPAAPVLLAAGALGGLGRLNLTEAMFLAIAACLIGDSFWFYLGRRKGSAILRVLCKISLEPDTCVRQTENAYVRYGAGSLLFAKFVPGLSTVAPPMAGMFKTPLLKFLGLDAAGSAIWAGAFALVGWLFRTQLGELGDYLERMGVWVGIGIGVLITAYILFKYLQRRRIYKALRIARITPIELKERLDAGETVTIVDLRSPVARADGKVPGALELKADDLDKVQDMLANNEIVLYCSCPNEATAARAALKLKRHGVARVRPLEGGFELWRDLGFPVEIPEPAKEGHPVG